MKSGGPWNLRGLRPEARAAARDAARRSGMSVGEWLNTVIRPDDEERDDDRWSSDIDREPQEPRRPRPRQDDHEHDHYGRAPWRRPEPSYASRDDDAEWRRDRPAEMDRAHRERDSDQPRQRRAHEPDHQFHLNFQNDERERERRRRAREPEDRFPPGFDDHDRERDRQPRGTIRPRRERADFDEAQRPVEGRPYREARRPSGSYPDDRQRPNPARVEREVEREREVGRERERDREPMPSRPPQNGVDASIDQAVAEIEARQRALDGDVADKIASPQTATESERVPERSFGEREPQPLPPRPQSPAPEDQPARQAVAKPADAPVDLSGLEDQLRQLTTRIEALRPSGALEVAINGLRTELAEISRTFTEALPRRALESLEIEIKALGQRIDHSRQAGVDATALAGIERGLAEVRQALHELTPAEGLVGFDETVGTLAKKIDAIVAREDPAALQQLEAAISALRGIVSHVASNDTLTKVAEDVRALAAKVDGLASSAANQPALVALENRIDMLAGAIKASTEAGHAVPRELEKLLSGLIEKLEWVQLTHTDHTALAHLEDRIAALVKRLDASDARFGLLEGIERGLADLLVHLDQLRGKSPGSADDNHPVAVDVIEHDVAEIKETERRTLDSLEAVQGTVEQVVDRLAMIESDMRVERTKPGAPPPESIQKSAGALVRAAEPALAPPEMAEPAISGVPLQPLAPEAPPPRPTAARLPIDPNLPPDHPLEPGSAARSRQQPSAADRIAASEAAVGTKPPVIPDPGGGKPDFIAAARRAAQAAAAASPGHRVTASGKAAATPASAKKLSERVRTVAVAAAVVVIVVGGFHIISRLFLDGGAGAPPQQTEHPQAQPESPAQPAQPRPQSEPSHTRQPPRVEAEPGLQQADAAPPPDVLTPTNALPARLRASRRAIRSCCQALPRRKMPAHRRTPHPARRSISTRSPRASATIRTRRRRPFPPRGRPEASHRRSFRLMPKLIRGM